ncbi:hypothetical protein [Streptomyces sp. NPDC090026]|uniref:hypothetical protein n=1 Tax=Streptomyces sp. NPDC090026 TaxID=3365923 RepID=UPI00380734FC
MINVENLEALMDEPGDRLPLVTAGEARTVVALLAHVAGPARELAEDLRIRIGLRLPT